MRISVMTWYEQVTILRNNACARVHRLTSDFLVGCASASVFEPLTDILAVPWGFLTAEPGPESHLHPTHGR